MINQNHPIYIAAKKLITTVSNGDEFNVAGLQVERLELEIKKARIKEAEAEIRRQFAKNHAEGLKAYLEGAG